MNLYADKKCTVNVLPDTTKKNASVPSYVPSVSSLRYLFSFCLDFRRPISRVSNFPVLKFEFVGD